MTPKSPLDEIHIMYWCCFGCFRLHSVSHPIFLASLCSVHFPPDSTRIPGLPGLTLSRSWPTPRVTARRICNSPREPRSVTEPRRQAWTWMVQPGDGVYDIGFIVDLHIENDDLMGFYWVTQPGYD